MAITTLAETTAVFGSLAAQSSPKSSNATLSLVDVLSSL